jgi:rubrerythrin
MDDSPTTVKGADRRAWAAISEDLHDEVPARLVEQKRRGGNQIDFIPWYRVQQLLQFYTNGHWHYEIVDREIIKDRICLTVQITIEAADGEYTRMATGSETLDTDSYGDFQSNAESMAFRRAAARFGLGLHLYNGS